MVFIDACFEFSDRTPFAPRHTIALLPFLTYLSEEDTQEVLY
jgi:hypothetical protein